MPQRMLTFVVPVCLIILAALHPKHCVDLLRLLLK
jgi:hypothetical protein